MLPGASRLIVRLGESKHDMSDTSDALAVRAAGSISPADAAVSRRANQQNLLLLFDSGVRRRRQYAVARRLNRAARQSLLWAVAVGRPITTGGGRVMPHRTRSLRLRRWNAIFAASVVCLLSSASLAAAGPMEDAAA